MLLLPRKHTLFSVLEMSWLESLRKKQTKINVQFNILMTTYYFCGQAFCGCPRQIHTQYNFTAEKWSFSGDGSR